MNDKEKDLKTTIARYMYTLGIPLYIKGYLYICEALYLTVADKRFLFKITTKLYPTIADIYEVTPSHVERAIRYAIGVCFENKKDDMILLFPFIHNNKKHPTNAEFLATITDHLCLDLNKI